MYYPRVISLNYCSTVCTRIVPSTSLSNFTGTFVYPSAWIPCGKSILRLSILISCCFFSASAICFVLIEPNSLPPSPVLADTSTSISFNCSLSAFASSISCCLSAAARLFCCSNCFKLPGVASTAYLFLSKKLFA